MRHIFSKYTLLLTWLRKTATHHIIPQTSAVESLTILAHEVFVSCCAPFIAPLPVVAKVRERAVLVVVTSAFPVTEGKI